MLSRRYLRIKVLQAAYAFFQAGNDDLAKGEKQLLLSIDKIHELIVYQLSFLIEIKDFSRIRMEESKKKFFPTEEDLNPNLKFIENRALKQIEDNREYRKMHKRLKINWSEEQGMVRKAYLTIKESGYYQKYLEQAEDSFAHDRDILARILKKTLIGFELLEYYYENKSIYWAFDTYQIANLLLMKLLKSLESSDDEYEAFPEILGMGLKEEDRAFMLGLFHKTILNSDQYAELIDDKAKNWDLDRIAMMDTILIKMALAELLEFPSIPVKVTLNEYIDTSKDYSAAKRKVFSNGVLDKWIIDLKEKNKIKKTGRGLMEF